MEKMTLKALTTTDLDWSDGTPISPAFDDVYYSKDSGMDETRYVFLDGIDLDSQLKEQKSTSDCYTIGETGFGTGLNFLMTYQRFKKLKPKGRLVFISVEKYPLSRDALEKAHCHFPDLSAESKELRDLWPPLMEGFHQRHFDDGKVTLLLLFGDIKACFPALTAQVNGWYLDGFAPSKNPDMWAADVFQQMARLSAPSARLATFTAAGFVRRGLEDAGFSMAKTPGFGYKRERLIGRFEQGETHAALAVADASDHPQPIAVIGAGLGGSFLAYRLQSLGYQCQLFASSQMPKASAVPAAILAPRFQLDNSPASRFFKQAYDCTLSHPCLDGARLGPLSVNSLSQSDKDYARLQQVKDSLPQEVNWLTDKDGHFIYPQAGSVDPATLIEELTQSIPLQEISITGVHQTEDGWMLQGSEGQQVGPYQTLVLAGGASMTFAAGLNDYLDPMDLRPNRGETLSFPYKDPCLPDGHYAYGGYLCDHGNGTKTLGSTFERAPDLTDWQRPSDTARQEIIEKAATIFDLRPSAFENVATTPFVGLRATTADHLPLVGPVPNWQSWQTCLAPLGIDAKRQVEDPENQKGLYILSGFGSKGLQYAPYSAEIIAAMITKRPIPAPQDILDCICPGRFLKRQIIKGQKIPPK